MAVPHLPFAPTRERANSVDHRERGVMAKRKKHCLHLDVKGMIQDAKTEWRGDELWMFVACQQCGETIAENKVLTYRKDR